MKVKDILKLIEDEKILIEIKDTITYGSYLIGNYKDVTLNSYKFKDYKIDKINVQYTNNTRYLILYINY